MLPSLTFEGEELANLNSALKEITKRWSRPHKNGGRVIWQSIFDDTFDHLVEAVNFIEALRHVLADRLG
jgi:hypothetical protein